jgi:RHS repeat-associated protein
MNHDTKYLIYDGARSIIEYDGAGIIRGRSLYGLGGDEIIARDNNGQPQFPMQDRLGSTIAVTGAKGQVLEKYRYEAFGTPHFFDEVGSPIQDEKTRINNDILFVGREWVSRFGFYENRARAYHPGLGRFMSEDPSGFGGGDANLYRYCANDPINRSDPSGLQDPNTNYGFGSYNYWRSQYVQQNTPNYSSFVYYNNAIPYYNAAVPYGNAVLGSPAFRVTFGLAELYSAQELYEFSILSAPTITLSLGFAAVGTYEAVAGTENVVEGLSGEGFEVRLPPAEALTVPTLNFNFHSLSMNFPSLQFANAVAGRIDEAIGAVNNAPGIYGPGTGIVTVTDSHGTHVVYRATFAPGPYGGFWPGTPGYYAHLGALLDAAQLYLAFGVGGGQPGEGTHPVSWELR